MPRHSQARILLTGPPASLWCQRTLRQPGSVCHRSAGTPPAEVRQDRGRGLPGEPPAVVRPCGGAHSRPRNANCRMDGRKGMASCHAFSGAGSGEPQKRHAGRISTARRRACRTAPCLRRTAAGQCMRPAAVRFRRRRMRQQRPISNPAQPTARITAARGLARSVRQKVTVPVWLSSSRYWPSNRASVLAQPSSPSTQRSYRLPGSGRRQWTV